MHDDAAALLFYLLHAIFIQPRIRRLHSEPNDNMNNNVEG